jgi:hypothetical protein
LFSGISKKFIFSLFIRKKIRGIETMEKGSEKANEKIRKKKREETNKESRGI